MPTYQFLKVRYDVWQILTWSWSTRLNKKKFELSSDNGLLTAQISSNRIFKKCSFMADIKFTAAYCYCSVFALRQVIKKVSLKDRFIKLGRREQKKKNLPNLSSVWWKILLMSTASYTVHREIFSWNHILEVWLHKESTQLHLQFPYLMCCGGGERFFKEWAPTYIAAKVLALWEGVRRSKRKEWRRGIGGPKPG